MGGRTLRRRADTLGAGGLFVAGAPEAAPGTEVSVSFRPSKHLPPVCARGVVRYSLPGKGSAIEFTEIDPADRQLLLKLIVRKRAERRYCPRAPLVTQVECQGCTSLAFSRDVSMGGMFLETTDPPAPESKVALRFNIDDGGETIIAQGKVLYCAARLGMGIEFTEISCTDRERIARYAARGAAALVSESVATQRK